MSEFSYYYDENGEKYEDEEGYIRKKKVPKTAYQWWIQERAAYLRSAEMYFSISKRKEYQRDMWISLFEWVTPDLWCAPSCDCRLCVSMANAMFEEELHYLGFYHEEDDD